jgi:excisionase family DNA binding protein
MSALPAPPIPRLAYSPREVATALGCTRQHVHNLIARGVIPSTKLGGKRLISAATLDRLISGEDGAHE